MRPTEPNNPAAAPGAIDAFVLVNRPPNVNPVADADGTVGGSGPPPTSDNSPPPTGRSGSRGRNKSARRRNKSANQDRGDQATRGPANHSDPNPAPDQQSSPAEVSPSLSATAPRYNTVGEIGRGGWGVVEKALDRQLNREVAIKRLSSDAAEHRDVQARFLHEAKITSQLQHPGIVPVHELASCADGNAYYVMKLLNGETLRQQILSSHLDAAQTHANTLTPMQLRSVYLPFLHRFVDVCNAIAYAHRQGIIHRDIKPANVMVGEFGETVVVDWGLAKRIAGESPNDSIPPESATTARVGVGQGDVVLPKRGKRPKLNFATHTGSIIGTPAYMPPEQANGQLERLAPQSDIYALGVTLFEIIAGQTPLAGCKLTTTIKRTQKGELPSLCEITPKAPRSIEAICQTAMQMDPSDRYASAELLAEDVKRFIAGDPVSVYREPLPDRLARWCRRNQTLSFAALASGLVILIASIGFGAIIKRSHNAERVARVEAEQAQRETLDSLGQARQSADAWLVDLSGALQFYPGLGPVRDDLVVQAIDEYTQLAQADEPTTPVVRRGDLVCMSQLERARANIRLCDLTRLHPHLNTTQTTPVQFCLIAFEQLRSASDALQATRPSPTTAAYINRLSDEIQLERINTHIAALLLGDSDAIATTHVNRDSAAWLTGQLPAACVQPWQGKPRTDTHAAPVSPWTGKLVSAHSRLGLARARQNNVHDDEKIDSLQAAAVAATWLAHHRGQASDLRLAETVATDLAVAFQAANRRPESILTWSMLVDDLNDWSHQFPNRPDLLQSASHAELQLANALVKSQELDRSKRVFQSAIDNISTAWRQLDSENYFKENLAAANFNLAKVRLVTRNISPSEQPKILDQLRDSVALYEGMLQEETRESTLRRLSETHLLLAQLLRDATEQSAQRIQHCQSACLGYELLSDHQLATPADNLAWAEGLIELAECLITADQAPVGLEHLNHADDLLKSISALPAHRTRHSQLRERLRSLQPDFPLLLAPDLTD